MATGQIETILPQDYDPRLYQPAAVVDPVDGLKSIGADQLEQFRTLGFVSVAAAFSDSVCDDNVSALLELADRETLPDGVQITFEALADSSVFDLPIEKRQDYIRKYMWFVRQDPRFGLIANDPDLLRVVGEMLGGEPEMFQEMALFKPPGIGREKPWHQDHAYFNLPEGTPVVGVWVALDAASLENGCMVFQPGGHKQGPVPHFNRRDWQICDSTILAGDATVAAPLPRGGCLIFDGLTPHGTPMNRSGSRRRAVQYHFVKKGTPRISTEERMAIFGSEGRDVSC